MGKNAAYAAQYADRNLQISFSEKRILNPSDNLSMPVEWPIK